MHTQQDDEVQNSQLETFQKKIETQLNFMKMEIKQSS